jgi:hypothetical protein
VHVMKGHHLLHLGHFVRQIKKGICKEIKHSNWIIKWCNADNRTIDDNNNSDCCFAKSTKCFIFKFENFNVRIIFFVLHIQQCVKKFIVMVKNYSYISYILM